MGATQSHSELGSQTKCRCCVTDMREPLGSNRAGIFLIQLTISYCHIMCEYQNMANCSVCGEKFDNDIRFLNHMMEKHGFRNPNVDKPDRNSRGY